MGTIKKGILTLPPERWVHLKWIKKIFWHKERQAAKRDINKRLSE